MEDYTIHPDIIKMGLTEKEVEAKLAGALDDCLEYANAEGSFWVTKVDLENMKFAVEFDIITVPEDDYIGLSGY